MDLLRTEEETLFGDAVRGVLRDLKKQSVSVGPLGSEIPPDGLAVWDEAKRQGWLELAQPESLRPNFSFACVLMAELGRAALASPVSETMAAAAMLGLLAETDPGPVGELAATPRLLSLGRAAARTDSDLLECTAGPGSSELVPEPSTTIVSWADAADTVVLPVAVRDGDRRGVALAGLSNPGGRDVVAPERVLDYARVAAVELPEEGARLDLLSTPAGAGGAALWEALSAARLLRAWELLGNARHAMEMTAAHVSVREQFDRTLASMQAVQLRLADMWLALEAAELLVAEAADLLRGGVDFLATAECASFAAGRAAEQVLQSAIHLHGGVGYMWEYDLHWHYRRVKAIRLRLGTVSQQLRGVAAAKLPRVAGGYPSWGWDQARRAGPEM